jgi:hypothetical protein
MGPIFKDQAVSGFGPLKAGPTGCSESQVTNYKSMLRQHPRIVNISIRVLHANTRGGLNNYEFYNTFNCY